MQTIAEQWQDHYRSVPTEDRHQLTERERILMRTAFFAGYCACYNESIRETKDAVIFHAFTTEERAQVEKELDEYYETRTEEKR